MKFVIQLERCTALESFRKVIPEHVAYLEELHRQGVLIAGGPFRDGKGGLILIEAADEAAADDIARNDPFVHHGVERYTLRSWEVLTAVRAELLTRDG